MQELISQKAEEYVAGFSSREDELLRSISDYTLRFHPQAQMLSGHVQGRFLSMISCLVRPHRILEIGTFMGYSALCLAEGLQPNGKLYTLEIREDDAARAKEYFSNSLYNNKIVLQTGDALQLIPGLHEEWDIVFIDADKVGYIEYYELTLPFVKRNGLVIADNVLFHGEVLHEKITGKNAKAIDRFNQHVSKDKRVEQVLLTVRDGISLIRKL
ncbi:MAG: O-methyltransferase [Ginsengibacter sp.]